jgi:hypothetical protein
MTDTRPNALAVAAAVCATLELPDTSSAAAAYAAAEDEFGDGGGEPTVEQLVDELSTGDQPDVDEAADRDDRITIVPVAPAVSREDVDRSRPLARDLPTAAEVGATSAMFDDQPGGGIGGISRYVCPACEAIVPSACVVHCDRNLVSATMLIACPTCGNAHLADFAGLDRRQQQTEAILVRPSALAKLLADPAVAAELDRRLTHYQLLSA